MTRAPLLVALAACGSPPAATPVTNAVAPHAPRIDFAVGREHDIQLAHTSDRGFVVDRTVAVPAPVRHLVWAGDQPIAWLDTGELGRVTPRGFEAIPTPAWSHARIDDPTGAGSLEEVLDPPWRSLFVAAHGETWATLCESAFLDGPPICSDTEFARIDRAASSTELPAAAPRLEDRPLPALAAPAGYAFGLAQGGLLTCTDPSGHRAQFPAPHDTSAIGFRDPAWISRSPPLFVADALHEAYMHADRDQRFFAGCAPTPDYHRAVTGPHDTVWVTGVKLEAYREGEKLGETEPGLLAFHLGEP